MQHPSKSPIADPGAFATTANPPALSIEYTPDFYSARKTRANESAAALVPLLVDLFHPASVVDIGCGTGSWLKHFEEHGVTEYLGIDGDFVDQSLLEIPQSRFQSSDLEYGFTAGRLFDLAVSLEVGEHLSHESSFRFVESLAATSSIIVFSAAIPFQGGTFHLNEQWPNYWASLFGKLDFVCYDIIRSRIWNDRRIAWWYRQNTLVFANSIASSDFPDLLSPAHATADPLALVHPEKYASLIHQTTWQATAARTVRSVALRFRPSRRKSTSPTNER